jgi:hypothetical protein
MLEHITSVLESLSRLQGKATGQARGGGAGPGATV